MASKQLRAFVVALIVFVFGGFSSARKHTPASAQHVIIPWSTAEVEREQRFMSIPSARLAEEHMKVLAAEPHIAGSPEDYKTAQYVARKFREAGLDTSMVEYKVWLNYPAEVSVDVTAPASVHMHGPTPEFVEGDPYEDNSKISPAFSGYSPSGDVEADVVYANYGRPEDFKKLEELGIDLKGKVVIVRYGENFRGVKTFLAQERGAAAVIIYSDPMDDGYFKGEMYPKGPWRPNSSVQRGTVEFGFEHPGDPTTPGYASLPNLPESKRVNPADNPDMPKILTTPLSAQDAAPILSALTGAEGPREWQGALPFTYHVGPGPVRVKIHLKQDYGYRTIWNVIGKVKGTEFPDEWVIAGNHRDAWVYGAVDPVAGTCAMLEAVHGLGELLKSGWRPKRSIIVASWDAEEQGLIGSTEWVEEHEAEMSKAVAYFNTDTGASGPNFRVAATPSLKAFLRDIAKVVPDPKGGSLYDHWRSTSSHFGTPTAAGGSDVAMGNLGSGSDYTSFVDHAGVPSSDIRTSGNYGVYHSAFDNYAWYRRFGDPGFQYSQMLARVLGMEMLRMADAEVLPFDYEEYGTEILGYLTSAEKRAKDEFGANAPDFASAEGAVRKLIEAGQRINVATRNGDVDAASLNPVLMGVERDLLLPKGLPRRPWFRHSIFAPADLKGYTASVIPGVNEAIDNADLETTREQLEELTKALARATERLGSSGQ